MKKFTFVILSFALITLPFLANAKPVVKSTQYKTTIVGQKKTVKKTVKKVVKKATSSKSSAASSSAAVADSSSCTIKGNISKTKEKIFHVLGCPNYGQTVIDTTKGERMFCSEQEAKDAGWRKALNCP